MRSESLMLANCTPTTLPSSSLCSERTSASSETMRSMPLTLICAVSLIVSPTSTARLRECRRQPPRLMSLTIDEVLLAKLAP